MIDADICVLNLANIFAVVIMAQVIYIPTVWYCLSVDTCIRHISMEFGITDEYGQPYPTAEAGGLFRL